MPFLTSGVNTPHDHTIPPILMGSLSDPNKLQTGRYQQRQVDRIP
jgi:hypothetical protein